MPTTRKVVVLADDAPKSMVVARILELRSQDPDIGVWGADTIFQVLVVTATEEVHDLLPNIPGVTSVTEEPEFSV